jgi:hypothetical protein
MEIAVIVVLAVLFLVGVVNQAFKDSERKSRMFSDEDAFTHDDGIYGQTSFLGSGVVMLFESDDD